MRNLYRAEAIAAAQAGDRMDEAVRVVRPRQWVFLAVGALLAAAVGVWLVFGTISTQASGPGCPRRGAFGVPVTALENGQAVEVLKVNGDRVQAGDLVLILRDADGEIWQEKAPVDGTIRSLLAVEAGVTFLTGDVMFLVERDGDLMFQSLIPASQAEGIRVGMSASVSPATAPAGTYGYIPGTVVQRSDVLLNNTELSLIAEATGGALQATGEPQLLITVAPEEADTPSGFAWSFGSGPDTDIPVGTTAQVLVTLAAQSPLGIIVGTGR